MGSKTLVYLGLLLAVVLLICSEVAAKEQAVNTVENKNDDAKYGNYNGYPGNGGNGGGHNGGYYQGGGGGGGSGGAITMVVVVVVVVVEVAGAVIIATIVAASGATDTNSV
uniref:Glycine-rich protein n=1 Tax=Cannabis sativa TaxID=3483 RepID=A0A803RAN8_CANSA